MEYKLICTDCKTQYLEETSTGRCLQCKEPLELEEVVSGYIDPEYPMENGLFHRYSSFFPFLDLQGDYSLGEGATPLVSVKGEGILGSDIHIKNEGLNPTWSFKDRGTITGLLHGISMGYRRFGTVSTGNMAASVAAFAAKGGFEAVILVKEEMAEEKVGPIGIYGPRLIKVKGDYSKLYSESIRIGGENEIYFINSDSPYRVEGYKTTAFEIYEQNGDRVPEYIVVPTSAGGNFRGIEKGFRELLASGITDRMPVFIASQASGCCPISQAFKKSSTKIEQFENPETIAHAIKNPFPPSGNQVLRIIERNKGLVVDLSDEVILEHQKVLALKGIFVQPASATSLAAANKLIESGRIASDANIVCIATASGLKFTESLKYQNIRAESCTTEELEEILK